MTELEIVEVLKFFRSCGGVYKRYRPSVAYRIIDCLERGQYLLERDQDGRIVQACCYWKIRESDFEAAKLYIHPEQPYSGPVFYLTDFASKSGVKLMAEITALIEAKEPGTSVFCFERKGRFVVWDKFNNALRPWMVRRV